MDPRVFFVYELFVEGENLPFYVGKGKGDRPNDHTHPSMLTHKSHKTNKIKKAIREGKKIIHRLAFSNLTEGEAYTHEIELINLYGREDIGTGFLLNQTDGGEGGRGIKMSEHTKKLIGKGSEGTTWYFNTLTQKFKRCRDVPEGNEWVKRSPRSGAKLTDEHKERLRESNINQTRSTETRQRQREAKLGKPSHKKGKHYFFDPVSGDKVFAFEAPSGWVTMAEYKAMGHSMG